MRKSISKTAGNIYDKMDKDSWMVTPKFSKVSRTSFLDVDNLILSEYKLRPETEQMDVLDILKRIVEKE